MSISIPHR